MPGNNCRLILFDHVRARAHSLTFAHAFCLLRVNCCFQCFWFASVHFKLIYAIFFELFIFFYGRQWDLVMPEFDVWCLCVYTFLTYTDCRKYVLILLKKKKKKCWCDFCREVLVFGWCCRRHCQCESQYRQTTFSCKAHLSRPTNWHQTQT